MASDAAVKLDAYAHAAGAIRHEGPCSWLLGKRRCNCRVAEDVETVADLAAVWDSALSTARAERDEARADAEMNLVARKTLEANAEHCAKFDPSKPCAARATLAEVRAAWAVYDRPNDDTAAFRGSLATLRRLLGSP